MLKPGEDYNAVYGGFRWALPERFNIGVAACDRHADGIGPDCTTVEIWPTRASPATRIA